MSGLLSQIESAKAVIDAFPIPPEVELNIRRQSTLRSSLFSARIEGNTLSPDDIVRLPSKDQRKVEIINILKVINLIFERPAKDLTQKDLLSYQSCHERPNRLSKFRKI